MSYGDGVGQPGVAPGGNSISALRVRPAQLGDAEALGVVHVRAWQAAYRGQLPQEYLDGLDPVARGRQWEQRLAAVQPPTELLVLHHDSAGVVGFAALSDSRDADAAPRAVGEVMAIYLLATHWGQGGGRLLMAEALRRLADTGHREATLWVLETNERARRFYEAGGWRPDGGTRTEELGGIALREVRYRRPVTR